MRQAQVIVFEPEEMLAKSLRPELEKRGRRLRELRESSAVSNVLREGAEILIVKLGRDLFEETALIERSHQLFPETAIIAVLGENHPQLTSFLWELGVQFVIAPPLKSVTLVELISHWISHADSGTAGS